MTNEMRWRFKVIDLPKPLHSTNAYMFGFIGMGFVLGSIWTDMLTGYMGGRTASRIILGVAALIFIAQGIHLRHAKKQLDMREKSMREWANRTIGPELKDGEAGDGSHGEG